MVCVTLGNMQSSYTSYQKHNLSEQNQNHFKLVLSHYIKTFTLLNIPLQKLEGQLTDWKTDYATHEPDKGIVYVLDKKSLQLNKNIDNQT